MEQKNKETNTWTNLPDEGVDLGEELGRIGVVDEVGVESVAPHDDDGVAEATPPQQLLHGRQQQRPGVNRLQVPARHLGLETKG